MIGADYFIYRECHAPGQAAPSRCYIEFHDEHCDTVGELNFLLAMDGTEQARMKHGVEKKLSALGRSGETLTLHPGVVLVA